MPQRIDHPMTNPSPVRGPYAKRETTAKTITDSARELFVHRGFDAVSLRDIATAAGLSHPALRRYFATTGEILDAIVRDYEKRNLDWVRSNDLDAGTLEAAVALARHNAEQPGYVELYTALAGVAVSPEHPAHARLAARYQAVREASQEGVGPARADTALLGALSDGLQLASLFDPGVDVADETDAFIAWWRQVGIGPVPTVGPARETPTPFWTETDTHARILRSAADSFARRGYHASSIDRIARTAGVTKSTLLHHVGSKPDLLTAVLAALDDATSGGIRQLTPDVVPAGDAGARAAEAYAVLLSEATSPDFPAHGWLGERIAVRRRTLAEDIGTVRPPGARHVSDSQAALWLHAARDGLRLQWLYDRTLPVQGALEAFSAALLRPDAP